MQKKKVRNKIGEPKPIVLKLSRTPNIGYVSLPDHPHTPGCVVDTVGLDTIIGAYKGPSVYLDFNSNNELIGIEILG